MVEDTQLIGRTYLFEKKGRIPILSAFVSLKTKALFKIVIVDDFMRKGNCLMIMSRLFVLRYSFEAKKNFYDTVSSTRLSAPRYYYCITFYLHEPFGVEEGRNGTEVTCNLHK